MNDKVNPIASSSLTANKLQAQMKEALKTDKALIAAQVASEQEFTEWVDNFAFTPTLMMRRFRELDEKLHKKEVKKEKSEEKEEATLEAVEKIDEVSRNYSSKNPELDERVLLALKESLRGDEDVDTMMEKLLKSYPDHYLADDALDFLLTTTAPNTAMGRKLNETKERLNELYSREIKAGRNISTESREFSQHGLGSPTALRDLYRNITGNPRSPADLFEELNQKFKFDDLTKAVKFIMHSLGSDFRSKGPSIPQPELQRLFSESRSMQAILGVYKFFHSRIPLMAGQFQKFELDLPPRLTYELLAKQFVKMISDRYPSADKILKIGVMLGIADEELAQIIIFTQYRDAIRGVSPRLFKSEKHRQEMLLALLDTLSELEDLLDEEEEEDE
ncbi:MAG: hypothetical protein K9M07_00545 [Simkaniaceae bacterium]|nr:hypothetical protein [Simkaniaceae bacterium]